MPDDRRSGDELDRRIADAKAEHERGITRAEGRAEGRGWAIGVEFVGAVLISTFIGYLLDNALGTTPWLMIALLVLGFAVGVYRAIQASNQYDADPTNDTKR